MPEADSPKRYRTDEVGFETDDPTSDRLRLEVSILASESAADQPEWQRAAALDQTTVNVLVVSNDRNLRSYIWQCLRDRADVCVLETADSATALAALRGAPPDLVILDAADGDPSASPLGRALELDRAFVDLPLIVLTDEPPLDDERTTRGGRTPEVVLAKPFNATRLRRTVSQLLIGGSTADRKPGET